MRMTLVRVVSANKIELIELRDKEIRVLKMNSSLDNVVKGALVYFLNKNLDVIFLKAQGYAWD